MVFMSACMEVKFYYELLNYIDMKVMAIHGRQKQAKRTSTFLSFVKAQSAVLLCTDVGARGLDIPEVSHLLYFSFYHPLWHTESYLITEVCQFLSLDMGFGSYTRSIITSNIILGGGVRTLNSSPYVHQQASKQLPLTLKHINRSFDYILYNDLIIYTH